MATVMGKFLFPTLAPTVRMTGFAVEVLLRVPSTSISFNFFLHWLAEFRSLDDREDVICDVASDSGSIVIDHGAFVVVPILSVI